MICWCQRLMVHLVIKRHISNYSLSTLDATLGPRLTKGQPIQCAIRHYNKELSHTVHFQ